MAGASAPAAAPAEPAGPEPILAMLASADMGEGEKVFKKCASCHDVEKGGPNKTGPNLYGIVGAAFAHKDDFSYSDGMANHGGTWGFEELNEFLYKPRDYIDGTKMSFGGLKKAEDRAAVIAWLNTKSDNPVALPDPAAVEAAEAAEEAVDEAAEAVEEAVDEAATAVEGAAEEAGDAIDAATAQ